MIKAVEESEIPFLERVLGVDLAIRRLSGARLAYEKGDPDYAYYVEMKTYK